MKMRSLCIGIVVMLFASVICAASGPTSRPATEVVVIDLVFLDELDRATPEKAVDTWENSARSAKLLYMVQMGDKHAIRTAQRILPQLYLSDGKLVQADWLALSLYDQVELDGIEKLSPRQQRAVLKAYDRLLPYDWVTNKKEFLAAHPFREKK